MDLKAETNQLSRDLRHYLTELAAVTDPRDAKVLTEYVRAIQTRLRLLEGKSRSDVWALSESDVWHTARRIIIRHRGKAPEVARQHADALCKANHHDGAATWQRILHAVEELLRTEPNAGERLN
jgi:hypothetical protein